MLSRGAGLSHYSHSINEKYLKLDRPILAQLSFCCREGSTGINQTDRGPFRQLLDQISGTNVTWSLDRVVKQQKK